MKPEETHLTSEQLVSCRDGELYDPGAMQHFASCEICQARVAEARRLASLLHATFTEDTKPPANLERGGKRPS